MVKLLNNKIGRFNYSNRLVLNILGLCFDRIESGLAHGAKTLAAPKAHQGKLWTIHSEYGICLLQDKVLKIYVPAAL